MKELKFRAWDKNKCKMAEVIEITFNIMFKTMKHTLVRYRHELYNGKIENESEYIDEKGNGNIVLMQYTGLQDQNGKEIYEGDICHWRDLETFNEEVIEDIFVVKWNDEKLMWRADEKDTDTSCELYDYTDNRELEVIGNIYENPDLLEAR